VKDALTAAAARCPGAAPRAAQLAERRSRRRRGVLASALGAGAVLALLAGFRAGAPALHNPVPLASAELTRAAPLQLRGDRAAMRTAASLGGERPRGSFGPRGADDAGRESALPALDGRWQSGGRTVAASRDRRTAGAGLTLAHAPTEELFDALAVLRDAETYTGPLSLADRRAIADATEAAMRELEELAGVSRAGWAAARDRVLRDLRRVLAVRLTATQITALELPARGPSPTLPPLARVRLAVARADLIAFQTRSARLALDARRDLPLPDAERAAVERAFSAAARNAAAIARSLQQLGDSGGIAVPTGLALSAALDLELEHQLLNAVSSDASLEVLRAYRAAWESTWMAAPAARSGPGGRGPSSVD
jgi:hypothetical protein